MKIFHRLLLNALVSGVMTSFLWFALTFWIYLETESVLATSVIGGAFAIFSAAFGVLFGTFVDRHRKWTSMFVASVLTLVAYTIALVLYALVPKESLLSFGSLSFWLLIALILFGSVVGNLRSIAMSTAVTLLVPEDQRDRANGLVGTVFGVSFTITSVLSGLAVGQLGMGWALIFSVALTMVAVIHLVVIRFPEPAVERADGLALIFTIAGIVGVIATIAAARSGWYRQLSASTDVPAPDAPSDRAEQLSS